MGKIFNLLNGMNVGISIAEIRTIPYFALIDNNLDRANYSNHVFFSRLLNNFHRKSTDGMTSFEMMFSSSKVTNQTYNAQVKMHFVIRQMGTNVSEINAVLESYENSLKNEFTDNFFDISFTKTEDAYENYCVHLRSIDTTIVSSVSKKEDEIVSSLSQNGYIYETFVPTPAENVNTSSVSNVLSQYPNCAVILQLIPTYFNQGELLIIEQINKSLQYYAATMMRQMMMRPDQTFQNIQNVYQTYQAQSKEDLFYYNFIVCSPEYCVHDICSKVVDALEDASKSGGSSYESVRMRVSGIDLTESLAVLPWQMSNTLIYEDRNPIFWRNNNRPETLIRLKQLITAHEARAVFKFPIDDGKTIGIESKKELINREKLNDSIIS